MTLLRRFRELRFEWRPELLLIFGAILVVYMPVFHAGFLPWDDDYNILSNPFYLTNHLEGLWAEPYYGMYIPVTSTVWGILYRVFGAAPEAFRALNICLHIANTLLVARLLSGLMERFQIRSRLAFFAAVGVFALHPLQVAAVAWISGGRDLLASFFALSALLIFFRSKSVRSMVFATLLFAFGLLSKPQIASLPVVIFCIVWFFQRERLKTTFWLMTLWCALAAAEASVTLETQAQVVKWSTPLWQRPLIALDSFGFYLQKTFWPVRLGVDYGRTPERALDSLGLTVAATLFAICALMYWAVRKDRKYVLAFAWFLLLAPVSGIVNFGFQEISTVADHYNYLALSVVAVLTLFLISDLRTSARLVPSAAVVVSVLLCFSVQGWQRANIWSDRERFFNDMVDKNPHSFSAMIGLGTLFCTDKEDSTQGLLWMGKALAERPVDPVAIADASYCLFKLKRFGEILALKTVFRDPRYLERASHHDVALSSFLASMASAAYYRGEVEKSFYLMCQANHYNPLAQDIRKNLESLLLYFAARESQPRSCSAKASALDLAGEIDRIEHLVSPF
jgi:hypothetical protein